MLSLAERVKADYRRKLYDKDVSASSAKPVPANRTAAGTMAPSRPMQVRRWGSQDPRASIDGQSWMVVVGKRGELWSWPSMLYLCRAASRPTELRWQP